MITEDYVSFETAKLLKEKGFVTDNITILVSNDNNHFVSGNSGCDFLLQNGYEVYPAPTLQIAMKWLREEKHIPIEILWHYDSNSDAEEWYFIHHAELRILPNDIEYYETYEEATEAAIKYCLENLI